MRRLKRRVLLRKHHRVEHLGRVRLLDVSSTSVKVQGARCKPGQLRLWGHLENAGELVWSLWSSLVVASAKCWGSRGLRTLGTGETWYVLGGTMVKSLWYWHTAKCKLAGSSSSVGSSTSSRAKFGLGVCLCLCWGDWGVWIDYRLPESVVALALLLDANAMMLDNPPRSSHVAGVWRWGGLTTD